MEEKEYKNVRRNIPKIDFKILDGLRGIAALYVLFNHARGNLYIGGVKYAQLKDISNWTIFERLYFSALRLTSLGKEFVILFFILSGFSIAYSLSKSHSKIKFYQRRVIRIYPPYLFALLWAFIVFQFLRNYIPRALTVESESVFSSLKAAVLNLLYVDNGSLIVQFWSLKFEVIFYILIPFFIYKRDIYFGASLFIAILSFFLTYFDISCNSILCQYILDYNFYFALGVFCFYYYNGLSRYFTIKNQTLFYIVSILLFLLMVIFDFWAGASHQKFNFLIASLFSLILIFNFLYHNIKNRVLMFLGNISYSIYISHFASLMLLIGIYLKIGVINSADIQNKYLWLSGIPFSLFLSYFFYLIIEKPTKQLLVRLRKKDEKTK